MNKRIVTGVAIALLLSALVDWFLRTGGHHGEFWAQAPGFFAIFGLAGCIVIVLGAKLLGRGLQVDATYYDEFERAGDGVSD